MNERNGRDVSAHLVARIDELALAVDELGRALRDTWGARLIEVEKDVDALLRIMRPRAARTPDAGDEQ